MNYIKKVILKNFQSHKFSEIEFDDGLNVIVGNSDSGKTAILRAIKWALYNVPDGDSFIREGEKEVSVKVIFNNGASVERLKSASKNLYILNKSDGEEMVFSGFRNTVPNEIMEASGMFKVNIYQDKETIINLAEQLDGPFLLTESPRTRAGAIGRLTGVNLIDDALRNTLIDNRSLQRDYKKIFDDIKNVEEKIKEYDYIKDKLILRDRLLEIHNKIRTKKERLEEFKNLSQKLEDCKLKKESLNNILGQYLHLDKIEKDTNELKLKILQCTNLKNIFELYYKNISKSHEQKNILLRFNSLDKVILICKSLIIAIKKIDQYHQTFINLAFIEKKLEDGKVYLKKFENLDKLTAKDKQLEGLIDSLDKMNKSFSDLEVLKNLILKEKYDFESAEKEFNNRVCEYQSVLEHLKICPTCFSKIDDEVIRRIRENI